ncbi:aspartate-semialdehyde dehydrogenase [Candidatus Woesearchaeota archaeon]|nr:aspartate-semialdehyde dehydrogenase [Candidatus Woesearchaeota archaeon]
MKKLKVGVLGATGMVGREVLNVLDKRDFPIETLRVYASERSAGKELETRWGTLVIENADRCDYSELDIAFFCIGSSWSKENWPKAKGSGCIVIDNSSAFRYEDDVPLVIPEINPGAIANSDLIANPNCTTAIAAIPLFTLHKRWGLKKVIISTYQATSGAGNRGMAELEASTREYLEGKEITNEVFQWPIAFNLIPHIDTFQDNLYTKEEMKVTWETRKIFSAPDIPISCTAVRIPTMRAHSEAIIAETEKPIDPDEFRELLEKTEGVQVKDDPGNNIYPMPLTASENFDVEVGRIRQNIVFGENGVEFFVSGDQILKGAALNAVQIGELVAKQKLSAQ